MGKARGNVIIFGSIDCPPEKMRNDTTLRIGKHLGTASCGQYRLKSRKNPQLKYLRLPKRSFGRNVAECQTPFEDEIPKRQVCASKL